MDVLYGSLGINKLQFLIKKKKKKKNSSVFFYQFLFTTTLDPYPDPIRIRIYLTCLDSVNPDLQTTMAPAAVYGIVYAFFGIGAMFFPKFRSPHLQVFNDQKGKVYG
jgi:hypothetical protein